MGLTRSGNPRLHFVKDDIPEESFLIFPFRQIPKKIPPESIGSSRYRGLPHRFGLPAIQTKDSSGIVSGTTTNYIGDELKLPKEVGQVNA